MKPDLAWLSMFALAGCGTITPGDNVAEDIATEEADMPTPDAPPDTPMEEGAAFRFYASLANGAVMTNNVFASASDVFVNASGTVGLAPGDYVFSVDYEVCPPNLPQDLYFPTDLPEACRTFTVGASGQIVAGAAVTEAEGVACTHMTGVDETAENSGGMTIGVAPFEIHARICSPIRIRVREEGLAFNDPSATILFATIPTPPMCGNAVVEADEECDDGNPGAGDGCSPACEVETGCGNGVCEPPEQCDDGNHHDGDGCSSSCELE